MRRFFTRTREIIDVKRRVGAFMQKYMVNQQSAEHEALLLFVRQFLTVWQAMAVCARHVAFLNACHVSQRVCPEHV